ncbi:selenide, water dikinase SelD [Halanaerobaculum tunisiense]
MGPKALSQVLRQVEFGGEDENLLVGLDQVDDAIAYQTAKEQIVIQSVDFFTPIVDDPYLFGQIAAANALSDIYAMGGEPMLAMNIVGFPSCLEQEVLSQILQGGADKVAEAGAIVAGGHTVQDDEPKYGLSVMGQTTPDQLLTNDQAQVGDKLILTKPLGMGIISTAIKGGVIDNADSVVAAMARLNNQAGQVMHDFGVNACTDITGFGLLGHVWELATASDVGVEIFSADVPVFKEVIEYAAMGLVPGGAYTNQDYLEDHVKISGDIKEAVVDVLFDPQTSGGLLLSIPAEQATELLSELNSLGVSEANIVGEVVANDNAARITVR